jgi:proteic killer suppression protein
LTRETLRYTISSNVIKSFRHKGLQAFFETGSKAGIQPHHAAKLRRQLLRLDIAKDASYMGLPGWGLHPLTGALAGQYAVTVNGNWRLTFAFDGGDAVLIDYQDYH